jgi:hypothetical protein
MHKNPAILYKTLVVVVIVLFIGIGAQPAVAVTPNITDSDDDCNLCPKKVSKSHLVLIESLLNRLEKYDNNLYENKEYKEFKEELLYKKDFNKDSFCDKLELIATILVIPYFLFVGIDIPFYLALVLVPIITLISAPGLILGFAWATLCLPQPT